MSSDREDKSLLGRAIVYTLFYGSAAILAIWAFVSVVLQVFWPERFPPP